MAVHEFGPFRYDDEQRVLFRGSEPVALQPKTFETFVVLFERRGQVVEKADLMRLVWPDTTVEETGLARNISQLRKALGDEAEEYIETAPKRGYRFRAAVAEASVGAEGEGKAAEEVGGRRAWVRAVLVMLGVAALGGLVWWQFYQPSQYVPAADLTLAVIPFEELSAELKEGQFSEGLTDVLNDSLRRLPKTNVIASSVIGRYREKGIATPVMTRLLRLDVVVEGSAQVENGVLRVNARITDVKSGRVIWSKTMEQPSASLLTAQASVAAEVERGAREALR